MVSCSVDSKALSRLDGWQDPQHLAAWPACRVPENSKVREKEEWRQRGKEVWAGEPREKEQQKESWP